MDGWSANSVRIIAILPTAKQESVAVAGSHEGTLISEGYGKPCSLAIDPIEKKPLYHFHPVPNAYPSPVPVATSAVRDVRTTKYHKPNLGSAIATIYHPKKWLTSA